MGKIVKFCSKCEESFAERFGFCPTCGAALQTFEMKPVAEAIAEEAAVVETPVVKAAEPVAPVITAPPVIEKAPEPVVEAPPVVKAAPTPVIKAVPAAKPAAAVPVQPEKVFPATRAFEVDRKPAAPERIVTRAADDGGFYVTVIEEKNASTRNGLIVATFFMMIVFLLTGVVYSIFSKDLDIGAIDGDDLFNAVIAETTPLTVEEEQKKKDDSKGGGGGGGGKEEKDPASKGDLPDQSRNPTRPPDAREIKLTNPDIVLPPAQTNGDRQFKKEMDRYGTLLGGDTPSNGPGTGGGIGPGRGKGVGDGDGDGMLGGRGTGCCGGDGNGNGPGKGDGDGVGEPPPTVKAVSQPLKIISKPRGQYTDAARQNAAQGTVTLRITFNANGSIGSISTVSGMSYGLTESAIAAARQIKFEPQKVNGIPVTVTKTFQYNFTLY